MIRMSESGPPQNLRTTLTGGIQDVSALLPLLGTDQCEHHVGSALEGGFGSLGIVKIGISVLISSISIPKFSISYRKFSINIDGWVRKPFSTPVSNWWGPSLL